nr:lysosomal beta glucosidase-like [Ipomoea batatas]GMC63158.1 lysosomal beta glucosidase-like [Ipomoea batatas]GME01929.1 lysosomal beta glucosidase-like [Ipomoea batatas]
MGVPSRVLWLWWSGRAAMAQEKYKDPKQPVGARVKDLLAEKIGQIDRSVASAQVMRDYFIGDSTVPILSPLLILVGRS